MRPLSRSATAAGTLAALIALTACGQVTDTSTKVSGKSSAAAPAVATSYPLNVSNCGLSQTFDKAPGKVLILGGESIAEVESMLALGLGSSILANTQKYGVYDEPGMAEKINALPSGNTGAPSGPELTAETVLSLKPDLVLANSSAAFDAGKGMATREQLAAIGAKTLINPAQCALGKTDPSADEKDDLAKSSWASAKTYYYLLGQVFNVQAKAESLSSEIDQRVQKVQETVGKAAGKNSGGNGRPDALIAFPGRSAMNSNGLPAIMTGNSYDLLLEAAGTSNAFSGKDQNFTRNLSAEQLAAAKVDVLVLGGVSTTEDLKAEAEKLFAAYPQWAASQDKRYVTLADSLYLGPQNATAIEKIAKAAYPDAFN